MWLASIMRRESGPVGVSITRLYRPLSACSIWICATPIATAASSTTGGGGGGDDMEAGFCCSREMSDHRLREARVVSSPLVRTVARARVCSVTSVIFPSENRPSRVIRIESILITSSCFVCQPSK